MALTRTQLRSNVQAGLASRGDVSDADINADLHIAQIRIARQHHWDELRQGPTDITLSASGTAEADKTVDLTGSMSNIRTIHKAVVEDSGSSYALTYMTPAQFDEFVPLPEYYSRDRPVVYTQWGLGTLLVYPVPDSAYTLRMRWEKWPDDFANDSDTSDLLWKDDMLVFLALSYRFALLREEEQANRFWVYYKNELKSALEGEEHDAPDMNIVRPNFAPARQGGHPPAHLDPFSKYGNDR